MVGTKSAAATLTMPEGFLFLLQLHQKSLQVGGIFQGVFVTLFLNSCKIATSMLSVNWRALGQITNPLNMLL
jgi:hypothetical protein